MKSQKKTDFTFWYGKEVDVEHNPIPSIEKTDNQPYETLKTAIQEEAKRKWQE
ncbi:hypothetical protein JCM9140_1219 [Halalkalibacter wakoensis JCM 9140]|uniref:Uncharacterized protein n=1 Tax=Halalkalibacter wakoensis JCM 9140 TaxID=1236970 RepID=W4PZR7_9BACI|nr:hypothetical protein [Halalkalibacter wakoensis]GAE25237.1 hypothetical protein JCM9140_1219 [Halalkalibacter wakoensis JCM 9140]